MSVGRLGREPDARVAHFPLMAVLLTPVHNPLVGPATWEPAATELRRQGWEVAVAHLRRQAADWDDLQPGR
jgi:hypothetical protein